MFMMDTVSMFVELFQLSEEEDEDDDPISSVRKVLQRKGGESERDCFCSLNKLSVRGKTGRRVRRSMGHLLRPRAQN